MPYAIHTQDLSFAFGRRTVVSGLSLHVPEGSIYGFLGPNGAGKSTSIRLLTGMLLSDKDNIFIGGRSLRRHLPDIFRGMGTLIESPSLYAHLTARENLRLIATLRGLPAARIDEVLAIVGLRSVQHRKVAHFSLGMKQRLGIGIALLADPALLILDEPANGLDPSGIIEIRDLIRHLHQQEGKTIFVSSHLLAEVEKTCTHIGIIHKGTLRYEGTLEQLQLEARQGGEVVFTIPAAAQHLTAFPDDWGARLHSADEVLFPYTGADRITELNQRLVGAGVPVCGIRMQGGLEDWFMRLTQKDREIV
ncbi:ABC transporter ATP-binding protein [Flaviaesturariibacter amylovorans]|uniref:ABC transporter domain-containing protein n=1 Tax=Flaviaesturariibacter amylovorans TaxID=1084520 RepID=A0ABP8HR54_9BACT